MIGARVWVQAGAFAGLGTVTQRLCLCDTAGEALRAWTVAMDDARLAHALPILEICIFPLDERIDEARLVPGGWA